MLLLHDCITPNYLGLSIKTKPELLCYRSSAYLNNNSFSEAIADANDCLSIEYSRPHWLRLYYLLAKANLAIDNIPECVHICEKGDASIAQLLVLTGSTEQMYPYRLSFQR